MTQKKLMEKYDWKITAKKGALEFGYVIIVGIIAIYSQDARFIALMPLFRMAENFLKHYKQK